MSTLTCPTRKLISRDLTFASKEQRIYFTESYAPQVCDNHYFLHAYLLDNGKLCHQGYIYFYLNLKQHSSHFIGAYVDPKYRGTGLCSLLIACWLKNFMENDFTTFATNKRQRKPFLLYQLKQFAFEIADPLKYEVNPNTIYLCQKEADLTKYLYFKNAGQAQTFKNGKIMQNDNYQILENLTPDIKVLDHILLSEPLYLEDKEASYTRSLKIWQKHLK